MTYFGSLIRRGNVVDNFHPEYARACFTSAKFPEDWPASFAVITGYARTGTHKPAETNELADENLREELQRRGVWYWRLTGYSPETFHAEPGWAVELPFGLACDLGQEFDQDAIYFVIGDELFVSHCDDRRQLVAIGSFRKRLRREPKIVG